MTFKFVNRMSYIKMAKRFQVKMNLEIEKPKGEQIDKEFKTSKRGARDVETGEAQQHSKNNQKITGDRIPTN